MIDKETKTQIKNQTTGYLMAALGLVAGLAWNDAIKSLIEIIFPFAKSGIFAKFIYAILITIVVVFLSKYFLGLSSEKNRN